MPRVPSIKGSVLEGVVEDLNKLVAQGRIRPEELERRLEPEDRELLESSIHVGDWFDIRIYTRMNELLRDATGGNEVLRERGRETARRLLEAGLYQQLEYLHRAQVKRATDPEERFAAYGRDLRLLATVSSSILSFSKWTPKPDPEHPRRHVIEVSEAADFPEVLCWRAEGFVNEMATQHGDPDLWTWERPAADLVLFRMVREL